MTVSELAEISDVSIASVSRFCRKVGLKGFAQLKISLAQELVDTHKSGEISNDISVDNIPQSLQNILANKITELKQTVNLINTDDELGIPTTAGTIWETQLSYSFTLGKGDVLIAISNSGESDKVLEAVKIANNNKAMTIGITNSPHSAIGEEVQYHITTATREKLFLDEFCFSRVSASTVIDGCLFLYDVRDS